MTDLRQPVATTIETPASNKTRGVTRLALAIVLAPLVVSAFELIFGEGRRFHAVSDNALNELHTRDVGHRAVLIGPFARDGWNHLGPAMYYLLALPYRLSGSNSIGLYLGALLINAASITAIALIAKRHGGTSLMLLTLLGATFVVRTLGPDFMRDPWNPYISVLPFTVVVFLTWAMTCGDTWALPVAVAVASFCAQTHIEYVTLAIPLVLFGAAALTYQAYRRRREQRTDGALPRDVGWAALIALSVIVVMWMPPVIEELAHSPGNFSKVFDYFGDPPAGSGGHNLVDGLRVVGGQFVLTPDWLSGKNTLSFGGEPALLDQTPFPLLLLPFLGSFFVFRSVRSRRGLWLAATVALALALGVFSVARTLGTVNAYRLHWSWPLAMLAVVIGLWAGWMLVRARLPRVPPELQAGCLIVLAVVSMFNAVKAARAGTPQRPESTVLATLEPAVVASLPPGDGNVLLQATNFISHAECAGLVLWLERQGIRARASHHGGGVRRGTRAPEGTAAGRAHGHRRRNRRRLLHTCPDQRLVAYWGDIPIDARVPLVARLHALGADFQANRIDSETLFAEVQPLLRQLGHAYAVFAQTPVP